MLQGHWGHVGLSYTSFYPWCSKHPETENMRRLADKVIPEVRRQAS